MLKEVSKWTRKKVLKDLQYRIETSNPNDPERENAVRLRDRLLARFGLTLEEIAEKRVSRWFQKLTWLEQGIVANYFVVTFPDAEKSPYEMGWYELKRKTTSEKKFSICIKLTDDEFSKAEPFVKNLLKMFRREFKSFTEKLDEQRKQAERGFRYAFLDKANLLRQVSDEESKNSNPGFNWSDVMRAAKDLEDLVFPQNHLKQETKQIEAK